ncbi:hemicentin-1-like isoform X2 [Schistocerca piceifrons]|uniref:hemicentin-1-like isoform X2 n=1 Tax=Schistocerca piceifrons TaxID=274613 RepID=UPI001F5F0E01|nr:hemicentin-1-like isoform X2 [Schistocerca piceifrons]XP_049787241.1 hemicentin-1-like isoform X2 [Schistocerca cancellata]XP_049814844.1 hemicentin-1-like isoform X2 [Schistocerca nitens]XP_049831664.1 hemicentin-1-like isoform X2 [Schistocerca gregaria]XP_049962827.1 hemicentin-1-like isoform X2 [Schistocerca serialis cubense]
MAPPTLALHLLLLSVAGCCWGLQIEKLNVPEAVRNGSQSSLILDCDYSVADPKHWDGLVVKWYFNNEPLPVYQWIKDEKPQGFGVLKDRLNLTYEASSEKEKKHRALQILNPTPDLSGEYKCVVSTFDNETSGSKKMVIFVPPEKDLEVVQTRHKEGAVNVSCRAEGVFPEPSLTITHDSFVCRSPAADVKVHSSRRDSVYDVLAWTVAEDQALSAPTTFHCDLRIPETNFTQRASTHYEPGPPTTTTDSPPEEQSSSVAEELFVTPEPGSLAPRSCVLTWLVLLLPPLLASTL